MMEEDNYSVIKKIDTEIKRERNNGNGAASRLPGTRI